MRQVILDCDPGIDDALAIFTLLAEPDVAVLGMCATVGNVPVDIGYRNLRNLAAFTGRSDVPVFRGAELPLVRGYAFDPLVHGEDGLGGAELPESSAPVQTENAVIATCRMLHEAPGNVTWIATGPLTNVALALRLDPSIREKVDRLVVMGGSTLRGNITPVAEFNVWADAEAWRVAVESGVPLTMVGLNVTHQVACSKEDYAEIRRMPGKVAQAADRMLAYYEEVYRRQGWGEAKLHDVVAVLEAIQPGICGTVPCSVAVETASALTYGQTVVDDRAKIEDANCDVAMAVDAGAVRRSMLSAIASF
ncbi:MAG: nucleoside hydrolase [Thermaerobacter sp.]|nr:nucleoside hydrolase [Thermaerobacter sp.]